MYLSNVHVLNFPSNNIDTYLVLIRTWKPSKHFRIFYVSVHFLHQLDCTSFHFQLNYVSPVLRTRSLKSNYEIRVADSKLTQK